MRKASALIVTAGLLLASLTACSTPGATATECTPPFNAGASSKLVSVTGDVGAKPIVDFPTPLKTTSTELNVVVPGDGAPIVEGQQVKVDLSVYNGTTGAVVQESAYDGTSLATLIVNDQTIRGLSQALVCAQVGSRLAVTVAPDDAFGPQGGSADLGIGATDTLVFVIDVVRSYLTRADGADQPSVNGLPGVVLSENGTPGISIPSGAAPTDLKVAVLKKGTGPQVEEGDTVTVAYTGVVWETKEVFDSTWTTGTPAPLLAADGSQVQGGTIPGFAEAMIGQTVGSQVIAVIPSDQGYGDREVSGIPAGSTLVFVFDVLGIN
ncbi:FKBP-type peptidyl-prolyl cis-trans isomerase [Cryobacterium sp. CG_9.6]|uniref:FKBP-type peptidyl-prolyl cis-trans isomerase n=1 Tax=Cryobacterium sp. CG_9.6 TaxID=2760710 RepID=UPI0024768EA0|nr:FKBP-type peptidyl-prolyl cis-trans isomerase [Cryobacterium sp. CG_9.6]MDH6236984.1 peptidylprolyl isomerase [Cryobacterium sp. CG_9.6]